VKKCAAFLVFIAILTAALLGSATIAPASAAVNYVSWSKDIIYVYDTTSNLKQADGSPRWPVHAAADRWAKGNPVDFRYTTRGCPTGAQCVVVKQSELASPTVGTTTTGIVGAHITSVTIILDTTFGRTNSSAHRQNVVCHELGHSLGLKHRTGTSSCLTPYVTNQRYPDATDIKNLTIMYSHV
jgi:predicted Zn-dependent protease